jgi:hypothetical protein
LLLYQIVILLLKNPNTIRTFSAAFSQKALCSRFPDKCEAAALRPNAVISSADWLAQKRTLQHVH